MTTQTTTTMMITIAATTERILSIAFGRCTDSELCKYLWNTISVCCINWPKSISGRACIGIVMLFACGHACTNANARAVKPMDTLKWCPANGSFLFGHTMKWCIFIRSWQRQWRQHKKMTDNERTQWPGDDGFFLKIEMCSLWHHYLPNQRPCRSKTKCVRQLHVCRN